MTLLGGYLGDLPPPTKAKILDRFNISTIPIPPSANSRRLFSFKGSTVCTRNPFSVPTEKHPKS